MTEPAAVFLVEDNAWDAQLALRTLARLGLADDTKVFKDGQEASDGLVDAAQHDALPRLVLLDLKLPKLTGLQVLQWIRANPKTSAVPVAILTGLENDREVVEIYKLGVSGYFMKPLDAKDLVPLLKQLGIPHKPPTDVAPVTTQER